MMEEKRISQSEELFQRAKRVIPGGVNSPVRAFRAVGGTPPFIARAAGSRIYDEDGGEYIDYVMSWGACILGHAERRVVEEVANVAADGLTFGAPTRREVELAEMISAAYPVCELVRLVNSGTEAVMSMVRVARGYTGRDKIIKFEGCYHGHSDGLLVKAGSGCLTGAAPDSLGVPASFAGETLLASYNDLGAVEALFEAHKGEVAGVLAEPVAANMGVVPPQADFLSGLQRLCRKHGALLMFDEVITGFRLAYGGAYEYYGVEPDLASFGKIVGGGMPLAAYGGKRGVMERVAPLGKVYQAGTLSGNPVAVAAGLTTLQIIKDESARLYPQLDRAAERLQRAYQEKGIGVNRVGSLLTPFFTPQTVTNAAEAQGSDLERFGRYFHGMLQRGVYVAPSQFEAMFVSAAHTEEDIKKTEQAIGQAVIKS